MGKKKRVNDHTGKEYPCLDDMCAAYGVPSSTYRNRRARHWTMAQALTVPVAGTMPKVNHRKPIADHTGRPFSSVKEMAEHWGITEKVYWSRLRICKWPLEKILTEPVMKNTAPNAKSIKDHEGNSFGSISEMCRYWKIGLTTYRERRKRGYGIERALTEKTHDVNSMDARSCSDHLGNAYPSLSAMCSAYGVTRDCYRSRLDLGWTQERALTEPFVSSSTPCRDYDGREFPSRQCMAEFLGLPGYAVLGKNADPENQPALITKYWTERACGCYYISRCIKFPWFLAKINGNALILSFDDILDEYHLREFNPLPRPVRDAWNRRVSLIRLIKFPWYLVGIDGSPVVMHCWALMEIRNNANDKNNERTHQS